MSNYDGLTRNSWTGTWSPSAEHPIVLDTEIRGGLRFVSGDSDDRLEDITGQRLQEGMLAYLKTGYDSFSSDTYYKYSLLSGESRDTSTGDMPNAAGNWSPVSFGGGGQTTTSYKYDLSGTSYTVSHNGKNTISNFYVLDPTGNEVGVLTNLTNTNLTVESLVDLTGHELYVVIL